MSNDGEALRQAQRVVEDVQVRRAIVGARAEGILMEEGDLQAAADYLREQGEERAALDIEYAAYVAESWNYGISPRDWDEWVREQFRV